jgi:endonuclease G
MHKHLTLLLLFALFFSACEDKNIDPAGRDDNMALGNPSDARSLETDADNYLLQRPQFSLSYNNSRGGANWVSWHLNSAWKGLAVRNDNFRQDDLLPTSFYRAATSAYTNSGFDRGHLCPAEDRDASQEDIDATFYMSNILPQAPNANRISWKNAEDYCRQLLDEGNELYIIAGGYGQGGTGSLGTASSINSGAIVVPARLWKVIVVLPQGNDDLSRISAASRVIAIDLPNTQSVNSLPWQDYRCTVDEIEAATGLDLLSNLPVAVQAALEVVVDAVVI